MMTASTERLELGKTLNTDAALAIAKMGISFNCTDPLVQLLRTHCPYGGTMVLPDTLRKNYLDPSFKLLQANIKSELSHSLFYGFSADESPQNGKRVYITIAHTGPTERMACVRFLDTSVDNRVVVQQAQDFVDTYTLDRSKCAFIILDRASYNILAFNNSLSVMFPK